jgi:mRNA interferase RelE/StbE
VCYTVEFTPRAARDFRKLAPEVRRRIAPKIDALTRNPRPNGAEKIRGGDDLYRIRVGDYRVLYQVKDQRLLVLVVQMGHRREIYRKL